MSTKQSPIKSKLFQLKEWLTVPEAARHLLILFNEAVSEADVLRLALDGRLKLSVNFVNYAKARRGKVVPYEDVEWREPIIAELKNLHDKAKGKPVHVMKSLNIDDERYLNLDDKVTSLRGVWGLSMVGNERIDVEYEYQQLTDGPEVTLIGLDGTFVENEDGVIYQIQECFDGNEYQSGSAAQLEKIKEHIASNNIEEEKAKELLSRHKKNREEYLNKREKRNPADDYYPAGGLPRDSVLVVRTQALIDMQGRLLREESEKKKPLDTQGERTYLNIIGVLLEVVTGTFKDEKFSSETKLRDFIEKKFDGFRGTKARTLAEKFALAKKALNGELD
ncbi:MAG: hypothetical protein KAJ90_05860 [Desulfobacterales bacterium]|nr:hypothetical protein [Desulfobacterales bacterium]